MASTSPKSPDLFEKRVTKRRGAPPASGAAGPPRGSASKSCSPAERPGGAPPGDQAATAATCDLEKELARFVVANWPGNASGENRPRGPGPNGGTPGSSVSRGDGKSRTRRKSKPGRKPRGAEEGAEVAESTSEGVVSITKGEIRTPPSSETSFDALLSCISNVLGKDEGLYDLEFTPVRTGGGEASVEGSFQVMPDPSVPQLTEMVTAFDTFYDSNSRETSALYLSPAASLVLHESEDEGYYGIPSEDKIARVLIGEIDLHVELENYLRAMDCFNTGKNRTKTTLQSNVRDDHRPPSSPNLQSRTDVFFDVVETKSSSSFSSATSAFAQQDGDKLHVFLDRKQDMASGSEEHLEAGNTKAFTSETELTDKVGDIRKIKSDNDPKKVQQEGKLKSSIKRTFGKTSFQSLRPDEERTWVLPPFGSEHSMDGSVDSYEKIQPFGTPLNRSCEEVKKRSSLLFTNSVYSLSAESFSTNVRKAASDSNRCQDRAEEAAVRVEPVEQVDPELPEETSSSSMLLGRIPQPEPGRRKWSPSLQELIEIYNSVLKQNKKLRSNSRMSVSRRVSSHLLNFLNEELKEKECKANLVMLSKTLHKRLRTPNLWKPGKQKKENLLAEYVSMFQEILHSSLSISQIARLNNAISGLQDYSERNYDFVKNLKEIKKMREKARKAEAGKGEAKPETASEASDLEDNPLPPQCCPKKLKQKYMIEKPVAAKKLPTGRSQGVRRGTTKEVPKPKEVTNPMEEEEKPEITEVDLPAPTELESMLQTCFTSPGPDGKIPKESDDKILVTVKLRGNQVLVSGLSYFKNEKALTPRKTRQTGTSELIIESVTREQVKDVWCKKTRSSRLREAKKMSDPIEKPKSEMSVRANGEAKKAKRKPKASGGVSPTRERQENGRLTQKDAEEPKSVLQFEYDQMRLRAQHPIEAIIESSESKISEHVGSSDEEQHKHDVMPPPEKKILLKDMRKTTLKEALKEALGENVFSKDLTCDFGWSDDALDKSLTRTKSYMINRETTKRQAVAKKQVKNANTVRSLNDLKNGVGCKRKARRQASSYLCYSSVMTLQEKSLAGKPKPKKQARQKSRSLFSSNSRIPDPQNGASRPPSRELAPKQQKPEVGVSRPEKSSVSTVMSASSEVVPDCSMELLFYDNEDPSTSVSPRASASATRQNSGASSEAVPLPGEPKPLAEEPSGTAVQGVKESPIVIHPPNTDADDMSFPSVMIHSDSFLKYYSSLPTGQANLHPLFKSSSDMKFYPGRVNSTERQPSPFVKFVLTPTQNADAELPPNQVEVVDKKRPPVDAVAADGWEKEGAKPSIEEVNNQISLVSIEKFIKRLSKSRKREKPDPPRARPQGRETPPTPGQSTQKKKIGAPGTKPRPKLTDRKPYHECQKRKLSDTGKAAENKPRTDRLRAAEGRAKDKTKPAESKTKRPKGNGRTGEEKAKGGQEPEGKNSESNLLSLRDFIATFSQIMESYQSCARENAGNERARHCEGVASMPNVEAGRAEGHQEKGTNTVPEARCSLTRMSDEDVRGRSPQAVRSANTQTDFPAAAEEKTETEDQPFWKPRTLKIKIHCDERDRTGKKAAGPEGNPQESAGEVELLDSFVRREPEGRALERRNSTYFDARDSGGGCKGESGAKDQQEEFLAYWTTVDLDNLRSCWVEEEKKESDGSPPPVEIPPESPTDEPVELLFDEILSSLQNGDISHSLALLDDVLRRVDCPASLSADSDRLRQVLLSVGSRSKSLIVSLERNAWSRVLSLLEDVTRMCGGERVNLEDSAKAFVGKLQKLNDRRLLDLHNSCSSVSQGDSSNGSLFAGVFNRITNSLRYLTSRISVRRSRFAHSIQSSLPEVAGPGKGSSGRPESNPLQRLRKEIQQQKTYIEFLSSAGCGLPPREVPDAKTKVVEKMKSFEKMLWGVGEGCAGEERTAGKGGSWGRAASLLGFAKTCGSLVSTSVIPGGGGTKRKAVEEPAFDSVGPFEKA